MRTLADHEPRRVVRHTAPVGHETQRPVVSAAEKRGEERVDRDGGGHRRVGRHEPLHRAQERGRPVIGAQARLHIDPVAAPDRTAGVEHAEPGGLRERDGEHQHHRRHREADHRPASPAGAQGQAEERDRWHQCEHLEALPPRVPDDRQRQDEHQGEGRGGVDPREPARDARASRRARAPRRRPSTLRPARSGRTRRARCPRRGRRPSSREQTARRPDDRPRGRPSTTP